MPVMADFVAAEIGSSQPFEAANLGFRGVLLAAAMVPAWEYALLLCILCAVLCYYVLGFHIVGDILTGYRGDRINLFYNPKSPMATEILSKCEVLRQRYWPTPWLCSPHLQTLFLHFFGRPPNVKYQRQLYVTSDGGTIALDWVNPSTSIDNRSDDNGRQDPALEETPTAIIVPGLTSDSDSQYVKHICASLSRQGWRIVVANHRGLGGVSITSEKFYNAGWTEDLRKIVLLVQQKYPKSPLLAIGLSIGANILVKYLGEEGPRTPVGGAVSICCPWDLLVGDRFMSRLGVQWVYNKALAIGLQQYAQLHENSLAHLIDWELFSKAASIRDFDNTVTRYVGKYETVDTYYRRCSSAQFVESIAVPLLCISAEDDPVCTKEAIPFDECRVNPNVILGVSGHGGHLAYFERFNATSLWWVRAATQFAGVVLSNSLMHQQSNVGAVHPTEAESNIDKGPFLGLTDGLTVAAQGSGRGDRDADGLTNENEGQMSELTREMPSGDTDFLDPINDADDGSAVVTNDYEGAPCTPVVPESQSNNFRMNDSRSLEGTAATATDVVAPSTKTDVHRKCHQEVTIKLQNASEVAALRSALSQLLDQVPPSMVSKRPLQNCTDSRLESRRPPTEVSQSEMIKLPIRRSVVEDLGNCFETAKDLLASTDFQGKGASESADHFSKPRTGMEEASLRRLSSKKDVAGIASQNRKALLLLTYVAVVSTFPLLGTALLVRTRGKIGEILSRLSSKRTL